MKNEKEIKMLINIYMEFAFIAGRWRGQVDLEEDMDNNYFDAFLQYMQIQKDMGVNHLVESDDTNAKYVRYKLRSDKWKNGVKKTTKENLEESCDNLFNKLQK